MFVHSWKVLFVDSWLQISFCGFHVHFGEVLHQQAVDEDVAATDAAQENQVNAVFEWIRVAFKDIEEFWNKSVIFPDKDKTVPHISGDRNALLFRGGKLFVSSHAFLRGLPHCLIIIRSLFWLPALGLK